MNFLAIIPARGGSKRIPRKNIREFMGRPMISYAISAALEAGIFDEIIVSTDDEEIADVARECGAAVPFMRSPENSGDNASTRDAVVEVLGEYLKLGRSFSEIACIYPCVPLLTGDVLRTAYEKFRTSGVDMLIPIVRYSHPVQRALEIGSDGLLRYREPDSASGRTQDMVPVFHDAGMFYFVSTEACLSGRTLRMGHYEMPSLLVQDIDTLEDWKIAEIKYRLLHNA